MYIQHLRVLCLTSSRLKHCLCPVNDYSQVQNKSLLTAEQAWVLLFLKKLPLQSRHGDLGSVTWQLGTRHRWEEIRVA